MSIIERLEQERNAAKAQILQGFFKTGEGQYGEGDIFLGIKVPVQRRVARGYENLTLANIKILLHSKIHEYRLIALLILLSQYKKADSLLKDKIVQFYLANTKNINNWDLVDLSCHYIIGDYLLDKDKNFYFTGAL